VDRHRVPGLAAIQVGIGRWAAGRAANPMECGPV